MKKTIIAIFAALALLLTACDSLECPLNNVALLRCGFYTVDEKGVEHAVVVQDTLTVTACGTDSVLLNMQAKMKSIVLPMSSWRDIDTIVFNWNRDKLEWRDTLRIAKTNIVHFETPDCPTVMFHHISSATAAPGTIDSVAITNPTVNYEQNENIRIYFVAAP